MSSYNLKSFSCLLMALVLTFPSTILAAEDAALDQYFVANAAYNRKLYPVAVTQFQAFLQKHGNHPKADLARRGLALSQYALKQYDKAMPQFAALLAKPGLDKAIDRERLIMLQGQCMLFSSKKDEARQLFIAQLNNIKNPKFKTAALAAICDICFGKSEWDKVLEWTKKLTASKPAPDQAARALYQQGYAFYQTEKTSEATVSLAKVAQLQAIPEWKTRAAFLLGECHTLLKEFDKAEPAYAAALPGMKGNDALECQYRLGFTRFLLAKYEPATADFEAYLKAAKPDAEGKPAPHVEESKFYIARSFLEREDYNQANQKFSQIAGAESLTAAKANLWWARVFSRQNQFQRSAQILVDAIKRFPNSPVIDDIEFDYANALISLKSPDWKLASDALSHVERRGKFGQMPEVIAQRSTCLHKLKDYNGSLRLADSFIARFKDHALLGDSRYMRAENLFLLNRSDESAKAYTDFIQAHKDHSSVPAAQLRIAQVHHLAKRWAQALQSAQPLLAKKPEGKLFTQLSFLVGDCFFRQDKWKESIKPFEDFINERVEINDKKQYKVSAGPNLDTALIQVAVAYDRTEDKTKALGHLRTLANHYPGVTPHLPLALAEQGRLSFQTEDLKTARGALERFINEDKANKDPFKAGAPQQKPRVMYYLGWVNAAEEKHVEAATYFSQVPRNHPLASDAALQQGIALINAENFEIASKHFPQMLNQFREHEKLSLVVYYAGLSASKQKDWNNAANHFKRVTEKHPKSEFADQALYEWAWAERARKRDKEAVLLYEKLLATHPKSQLIVKVQSELAELNLDSGAQEKVIAQLTTTLKGMKDDSLKEPIRIQLASAHFKKADFEIAAGMFEKLIIEYPESKLVASMLFQAGEARFKLKETVTARDHFAASSKVPGIDATLAETVTMRLGETQSLTGQHKEASQTYRNFLNRFKESKWIRNAQFGLAYALENNNNPNGAISEYRKLLSDVKIVDLWTVRSRFQTGECLFNLQNYEKAIAEFVNVEINFKKYPSWQAKSVLEIGRVLLAQDKKEEATQRFKDVINKYSKEKAAIVARQYLDELRTN